MQAQRSITKERKPLLLLLTLAVAPVYVVTPAHAQYGHHSSPSLSDATGPFLGGIPRGALNMQVAVPGELRAVGVNIPLPMLMTQVDRTTSEALTGDVIVFNAALDDLLPYCGCGNVNWKAYNNAVKATKQLRKSLTAAVASERGALPPNATPQQIEAALKRISVIEEITTALEKATQLLAHLKQALDKAR